MSRMIPIENNIIVHINKKTGQKGCTIPRDSDVNAGDKVKVFKIVD